MIGRLRDRILDARSRGCPVLIVLAGSNGAGKSTFHRAALAGLALPFVNADEIALRVAGTYTAVTEQIAYAAMQKAETERRRLIDTKESFVMETVLSDTQGAKLKFFSDAGSAGYFLVFIHITLPSVEMSMARVAARVCRGGHDVPDEKLRSRFARTRENAAKALRMADFAVVLDNASLEAPYRLIEEWEAGIRTIGPV